MKYQRRIEITYSYPTSPHAVKGGFSEEGCWSVSVGTWRLSDDGTKTGYSNTFVSAHETEEDAIDAALEFQRREDLYVCRLSTPSEIIEAIEARGGWVTK